MKSKIIFSILLLIMTTTSSFSKIFVPSSNGFVEKKIYIKEKRSIINISKFFGYNEDQFHLYLCNSECMDEGIIAVIFKQFSESIIFILAEDKLTHLSNEMVESCIKDFSFDNEYDPYTIESELTEGINNKSLNTDFFEEIFDCSNITKDGRYFAKKLGYELHFENGILVAFNSPDGLNKWAKQWKENNYEYFVQCEETAEYYWDNDQSKVINEINIQAEAYSKTPMAAGNEYVEFHTNDDGTINFKMLMVAHYNEKITLTEFKEINHGRYELIDEFTTTDGYKRITYKVNKSFFTFNSKGDLVNTYTTK